MFTALNEIVCVGLATAVFAPSASSVELPHAEFAGFVGARAAELLDGRALSSFARVDAMDEAVRAFETHEDDAAVNGTVIAGRFLEGPSGAEAHPSKTPAASRSQPRG